MFAKRTKLAFIISGLAFDVLITIVMDSPTASNVNMAAVPNTEQGVTLVAVGPCDSIWRDDDTTYALATCIVFRGKAGV
jgi:hypothetical protein